MFLTILSTSISKKSFNIYREVNWINLIFLTSVPIISLFGACTTNLRWETAAFSAFYYFVTGLGITAGYHRLWAHRSYNASKPLKYFLAMAGSGAVQGSKVRKDDDSDAAGSGSDWEGFDD